MQPTPSNQFAGENSDEYNALFGALEHAASAFANDNLNAPFFIYDYLSDVSSVALVTELTDALHDMGYCIQKRS